MSSFHTLSFSIFRYKFDYWTAHKFAYSNEKNALEFNY